MATKKNLSSLSSLAKHVKTTRKDAKEILVVDCEQIASREQTRKKFRKIDELAASIEEHGQIQPVVVSPKNDEGLYVIQKGERRWRACKKLGRPVEVIVNYNDSGNMKELASELVENIQREDLEPMEIANGLQKFVDEGWSQQDISQALGMNKTFVSMHLSLLKLPDIVMALYDDEAIRDVSTLNDLRQLYTLDEERTEMLCAEARSEGLSRGRTREILRDVKLADKQRKEAAKRPPEATEERPSQPAKGQPSPEPENAPEAAPGDGAPEPTDARQEEEQFPLPGDPALNDQPSSPDVSSPQATPVVGSGGDLQSGEGWREVAPGKVTVMARFTTGEGESLQEGELMSNRVDDDPAYVWVLTDGGSRPVRVLAQNLAITSVLAKE